MMIDVNAAITLLEKTFQSLNGIRTHNLWVTSAMLSQLGYESHMGAVMCGLIPYVQWT